ncbi:MAG: hypothetical protein AAF989_11145, partial [Planctomycetota bacterium]
MTKMLLPIAAVAMLFVSPVLAQDAAKKKGKGKRRSAGAMLVEKLQAAELTDEQQAKVAELGKKYQAALKKLRESGLTQELSKKKAEITKKLREEKKSQKEIMAAVAEAFSKEQVEMFGASQKANSEYRKAVYALLSKEQLNKLS